MELFALNLLLISFKLFIYYCFFHFFFGETRFSKPVMFLLYLVVGVVTLFLSNIDHYKFVREFGYFFVLIGLVLCYEGQTYLKVFWTALFQIIGIMMEVCYHIVFISLRIQLEVFGLMGYHYFLGVVLSNLTIILLLKLFLFCKGYFLQRNASTDIPLCYMILFLFPISMLFVIHQYVNLLRETAIVNLQVVLPVFVLTGVTIIFFFFFDYMLHARYNKQQIKVLLWQLDQERQYHEILLNKHQQFQGLRHDMKNHFIMLAGLIKNGHEGDALQYAQRQAGKLAYTSAVQTGHALLDTILTIKEDQARQIQVEFQCHVLSGLQIIGVELDDLASLLANILDNALEAVEEVPISENRKIWCRLLQKDGYLHIVVRNTVLQDIDIINNLIETTKSDKNLHGHGLQNIKLVVEKYGGKYSLACKDKIFSVKISLPVDCEEKN